MKITVNKIEPEPIPVTYEVHLTLSQVEAEELMDALRKSIYYSSVVINIRNQLFLNGVRDRT